MLRIHLIDGPRAAALARDNAAGPSPSEAPLALPGLAALRLLAYAIVHRDAPMPRDAVAFALWPDVVESKARARLRLALHQLAAWLEAHAPGSEGLQRTRATLAWMPSSNVWVDLVAFQAAVRAGGNARMPPLERRAELERALAIGSTPLLPDWDEPWLERARRELDDWRSAAIDWLVASSEADLDHATSAHLWRLKLDIAPLDEVAHRGLMRALVHGGDTAAALAQFDACATALSVQLGVAPHPATRALRDAIAAAELILPGDGANLLTASPPDGGLDCSTAAPPAPLDRFVGRAVERQEVLRRAHDPGVVAIVGPGGAGKTRLANEVAWSMAAREGRAVVWVELAETAHEAQVLDAVARALGILPSPGAPLRKRVLQALADQPALLVLDNCEQVQDAVVAFVAEVQGACPSITVLVTSRIELGVAGEASILIGGLDVGDPNERSPDDGQPAAVELFIARMGQRWPTYKPTAADVDAMARICRMVDGLPLAIELAVARSGLLDLATIADGLAVDIQLLRDMTTHRALRHRTMEATIGWSYRLLAPEERDAFRRLAVFAGSIDAPATAAVAFGIEGAGPDGQEAALATLHRLASQSLLVRDPVNSSRFRMLQPIRHFASAALQESAEASDARARHAAHFIGVVRAVAGTAQPGHGADAYRTFERDLPNLNAALSWLLERERFADAVEMVRLLTPFWFHRSHLEWALGYVQALLDRTIARPHGEPSDATVLYRALSLIAFRRGDVAEAIRRSRLVVEYQRQIGDPERHLDALVDLTTFLGGLGQFGPALAAADEACRLAAQHGKPAKRAEALQHAALIHLRSGAWDTARSAYDESLALARALGLPETNILLGQGTLAQSTGDYAEAEARDRDALERLEAIGDQSGAARAHNNLGRLYNDMGRHGDAMSSLRRALAAWRATGRRDLELFVLNNMGEVELRKGNLASAKLLLERSLHLKRGAGNDYSLAFTLLNVAELALARGDHDDAGRALAEARERLELVAARDLAAWADRIEAEHLLARGEASAARTPLERALKAYAALGARRDLACGLDLAARLALDGGRHAEAGRLAEAAGTLREAIGAPRTAHERAAHERLAEQVKAAIGPRSERAARAQARRWTLGEAVASALDRSAG